MPPPRDNPGLLRNLGAFFGHIVQGIRSNPAAPNTPAPPPPNAPHPQPPEAGAIRQEVREQTVVTPTGEYVLRRTVIDEVRPIDPCPDPAKRRSEG